MGQFDSGLTTGGDAGARRASRRAILGTLAAAGGVALAGMVAGSAYATDPLPHRVYLPLTFRDYSAVIALGWEFLQAPVRPGGGPLPRGTDRPT